MKWFVDRRIATEGYPPSEARYMNLLEYMEYSGVADAPEEVTTLVEDGLRFRALMAQAAANPLSILLMAPQGTKEVVESTLRQVGDELVEIYL